MASKKKTTKKEEITSTGEIIEELAGEKIEPTATVEEEVPVKKKQEKKGPKYPVGSIVYVSKETSADLNGFNLSISQYKKEAYTVEAYDENTGVYKIRHIKLLLNLKEADLVAPDVNAHDSINRKQF